MMEKEPTIFLPPAVKTETKWEVKGNDLHPLVEACKKPKKNNTADCLDCNITFKQKKFLLQHRIEFHGEKPEWQCKECGLILSSKYILDSHMDRHTNTRKHKCPVCPAAFNTRASQKRHFLYKHTEERPHQCTLCEFATVEHDKLLIHLRNHTGESPYVCDSCGMTFKTPISYKRHVVTHTGSRHYLCPLCLKKFGTPVTAKQHMFTSHGIFKQMLTPIRSVREHGLPSMLATFLEDVQLGDWETKMVDSLKYYDIQKDVMEEIDIINVDFSIFSKKEGKFTVDKSPFFMLKSKHPICHRPANKNETETSELGDSEETKCTYKNRKRRKSNEDKKEMLKGISEELDKELENAIETAEAAAFLTKEHHEASVQDGVVSDISENIETNKANYKDLNKVGSKIKRCSKKETKAQAASKSSKNDEVKPVQFGNKEMAGTVETKQVENLELELDGSKKKKTRKSANKTDLRKKAPSDNISVDSANELKNIQTELIQVELMEPKMKKRRKSADKLGMSEKMTSNSTLLDSASERAKLETEHAEVELCDPLLDGIFIENSENVNIPKNDNKVTDNVAPKTKRRRKSGTKTEITPTINENEAVKTSESLQTESTEEELVEQNEKSQRKFTNQAELTEEIAVPSGSMSQVDNADEFHKDEDSLDAPVFVNLPRKSFALKTPRRPNPVTCAKEMISNESESNSAAYFEVNLKEGMKKEQIQLNTEQTELNMAQAELNTTQTKLKTVETCQDEVDGVENVLGPQEMPGCQEEIPYPTNFISVVTEDTDTAEGQLSNFTGSPKAGSGSLANSQNIDCSMLKDVTAKSLPPFISLRRCSPAHQERLLTGMKKGVFGPTPSVIRVLEDGSMINVSSLYKSYLPPAPKSQTD